MKIMLPTISVLLLLAMPARAQSLERGYQAAQRGDYATALQEWRPLAEEGNALAQTFLAGMYVEGRGVPQDYVAAVKWSRLAAEQGNALAQTFLGALYGEGRGVPQDYAEAAKWLSLAAEQGNALAQAFLGAMYILGRGVQVDLVQAHKWYNLAAAQGNTEAAASRDNLAKRMTAAQIAEAQKRAREWLAKRQK